jgi:threonine dehydratase
MIGGFKVRGGIVYFDHLKRARPHVQGIVTATRGNHGQSLAFAGRASVLPSPSLCLTVSELDTIYVPIGLGSGICGVIGTRDLLGQKTSIVGVVAEGANTYARSVASGRAVPTNSYPQSRRYCAMGIRTNTSSSTTRIVYWIGALSFT